MSESLAKSDLEEDLKLVTRGKVRDLYEVDDKTLLVVATDRISAFDVVMDTVRMIYMSLLLFRFTNFFLFIGAIA